MPTESYEESHENEIGEGERHQIFPLEGEHLVDSDAGESPLEPDDYKRDEESLCEEPYGSGDSHHNVVETFPSRDNKGHPATEEHEGSNAGDDKEVEVFSEIEESEVDT